MDFEEPRTVIHTFELARRDASATKEVPDLETFPSEGKLSHNAIFAHGSSAQENEGIPSTMADSHEILTL